MPYKDPERQREFQRQRNAKVRAAWLAGKCCVDCGSVERLECDHVDRSQKVSHRVWTWAPAKREEELAKCVVRCRACHQERHAAEMRKEHGSAGYKRGCRCEECRSWKSASNRRYLESRRQRESNARTRFCRALPNHSAMAPDAEPYCQLSFLELAS